MHGQHRIATNAHTPEERRQDWLLSVAHSAYEGNPFGEMIAPSGRQGLEPAEIAARLGVPLAAIDSLLRLAAAKLARLRREP